ncbi:hypothetical protein CRE_05334 [Caenorhabditis remanei]|uniref:Forkhead box protein pes-1 n=1 Tax=Caenorhabditis remanei TaxID=31234 RepID=E3NRV4_CAERE|nr:hypothetical protein CRE_05334 [Caenorhabditis remanei]
MKGFTITDLCPEMFHHSVSPDVSSIDSSEASTPMSSESMELKSNAVSPAPSSPESKETNPLERPPYSYNSLIAMAIQSSPFKRLRLSEIYSYISNNFPYYQMNKSQWQNSVRHNLSLHKEFQKVRTIDGKGSYWEMTAALGTEMYIGKECGKLRRQSAKSRKVKDNVTQLFDPSPLLGFTDPSTIPQLPNIPLYSQNPMMYNLTQAFLQNPHLIPLVLQNFPLQNPPNFSGTFPTLSFPFPSVQTP